MHTTNAGVSGARATFSTRVLLLLPIFFLWYWVISSVTLWWAYSISTLIRGGYYEKHQALELVVKMGLLVTVLTSFVWLFRIARDKSEVMMRRAWTAAWQTALILIVYAAAILLRLQFGGFASPLPNSAVLPVLGALNSHFFSEADSLVFLLTVTPIMACVSGLLYFLQCLNRLGS